MGKGKRTEAEQQLHDQAVKIRKMTDLQIAEYLKQIRQEAYEAGLRGEKELTRILLQQCLKENDRLTHKRTNSSGYWSGCKKDVLIYQLGLYEDTGVIPQQIEAARK